jgi:uncharacterized membrane protein
MIHFFSKQEEEYIIDAIQEAEKVTSGEIRVHLERKLQGSVMETATQVFAKLGMQKTEQRNGVLIFLAPRQKSFAIIGDKGINEKVPDGFWDDVRDVMQKQFREGQFVEGICDGVQLIGKKLVEHFPYQKNDKNELSDDISYGN